MKLNTRAGIPETRPDRSFAATFICILRGVSHAYAYVHLRLTQRAPRLPSTRPTVTAAFHVCLASLDRPLHSGTGPHLTSASPAPFSSPIRALRSVRPVPVGLSFGSEANAR